MSLPTLQGGSVLFILILCPSDSIHERHFLLTQAPQPSFRGSTPLNLDAVHKELDEVTGLKTQTAEIMNLTALAGQFPPGVLRVKPELGVHGYVLAMKKEVSRKEIVDVAVKMPGRSKFVLHDEWAGLGKAGLSNARTLHAWGLYESLNREGEIEKELQAIWGGRRG